MEETPTNITEEEKKSEPTIYDVGTRYQHLVDYKDSLEVCRDIVRSRGDLKAAAKFATALEVVGVTVDSFSGYRATNAEYTLYKLLNSVPRSKDALRAIGGEPLD